MKSCLGLGHDFGLGFGLGLGLILGLGQQSLGLGFCLGPLSLGPCQKSWSFKSWSRSKVLVH